MPNLILVILLLIFSSCSTQKIKVSYGALLENFKYPFEVQYFTFKSQNQTLKMAYMDLLPPRGKQESKTVVLLHGKNFSGYYWKRVAQKLQQLNYRVIIPDQIGFGKSSKPTSYQHSFGQFSINTNKLLDSLGVLNYELVGHSMGGMLAITNAYLNPRRVSKLLLINPIGLENYLDYAKFKDPNFFFEREKAKTPQKIRSYQKKNYYDGKWKPEYEELLRPAIGQLSGTEWKKVAWSNALTYGPIFSENITYRISKLAIPTTFILGTRDRTGPGRGWKRERVEYKLGQYQKFPRILRKLLPSAKVIELKGLGHMPHFEDKERFSAVFYPLFK